VATKYRCSPGDKRWEKKVGPREEEAGKKVKDNPLQLISYHLGKMGRSLGAKTSFAIGPHGDLGRREEGQRTGWSGLEKKTKGRSQSNYPVFGLTKAALKKQEKPSVEKHVLVGAKIPSYRAHSVAREKN